MKMDDKRRKSGEKTERREGAGLSIRLRANHLSEDCFDLKPGGSHSLRSHTHTHTHTHWRMHSAAFPHKLHGDKCVSLASSLVLSARIRAYQHSCMCCPYVCVCVCVCVCV